MVVIISVVNTPRLTFVLVVVVGISMEDLCGLRDLDQYVLTTSPGVFFGWCFVCSSGGGFITGKIEYPWAGMGKAASERYAAVTTHGGHAVNYSAASWALLSPGNVNLYALENFASVSLNDMTVLGKQVTESYYAKKIKKSYWNGCSTGGRQGFMMAQRYSKAYNGILASASAMNWAEMVPGTFWLQRVMHEAGYFPSQYDLEATNKAAVAACDELDGLKDGVIERLGHYTFAKWL
ncbi:tannase and feruloyl esterase-domain-containing protein [Cadophora sp. MPI-SDFR-AT-0126]|nr:tannase and feruloyl esterase-domain-containing protein [Leotiomycetes sp. MPI-SDFR-AT-0126]